MTDNILEPNPGAFANFSIENAMEYGNKDLLAGLTDTATASADPEEIEVIKEEPVQKTPVKKEAPKKEVSQEEEEPSLADALAEEDEEEEKVSKEKSPKKQESSEEEEESEQEVNTFTSLAKDLAKLGVFSVDEDEELNINTPEEFLERFNQEKQKGAIEVVNNFIGQFGEDYQKAFDAIFVKGVDPKEYFQTFNKIQSFADLDLSKESNQEAVVRKALEDQGFEAEDIDSEVERIKNYGDLEAVAQKHHKVIVKREQANLQQLEAKKEQELAQKAAQKQQYFQNVSKVLQEKLKTKEFDGIPLTPKTASEIQDYLLQDKYKLPTGELLTEFDKDILELKNPENHETKVKLALLMKLMKEDPTLSTIQKKGITKQSNQLFSELARQTTKTKPNKVSQAEHWSKNL